MLMPEEEMSVMGTLGSRDVASLKTTTGLTSFASAFNARSCDCESAALARYR